MINPSKQLQRLHQTLASSGEIVTGLVLRLFLAYEFAESGLLKLASSNWFVEINGELPFPFYLLSADVNWLLVTWVELLGATLLLLGLATRYVAFSLLLLTLSAWYSVHSGYGYNVCSNGYQMAVIYIVTLLPLLTSGAGRWSLDHWRRSRR